MNRLMRHLPHFVSRLWLLCLAIPLCAFTFAPHAQVDLSTPELAFGSLVQTLQLEDGVLLEKVVTPTGMVSLEALHLAPEGEKSLSLLGKELSSCKLEWSEITDDIYFLKAHSEEASIHKLEFTKEEPGWMLYHWQVGGGVDLH